MRHRRQPLAHPAGTPLNRDSHTSAPRALPSALARAERTLLIDLALRVIFNRHHPPNLDS
jgi:hypothetical protein